MGHYPAGRGCDLGAGIGILTVRDEERGVHNMKWTRTVGMAVCAAAFCVGAVVAQEQKTMTRDQYFKKVGECAMDKTVLATTLEQVEMRDCVEFTRRTLKAVTRMPVSPEVKAVRYVETSILCVNRAQGDEDVQLKVVAETIALSPVADLPGLVKELAKRFDPKANNLTAEKYKEFAEKGIRVCVARNAEVDDTKVRNTFAVLLFTRAAPDVPGLQDALLAELPDDSGRRLATAWLAAAADDDYTAILAAAEIQTTPPMPAINMAGYPQTARLLTYLSVSDSTLDALEIAATGTSLSAVDIQIDSGIQQTPFLGGRIVGYQNQGMSLTAACGCRDRR